MMESQRESPDLSRRLWNLATAAADFARDGFATVDETEYRARLAVCNRCDRRQEAICSECGCYIKPKAAGRAWSCPIDRWDVPDISLLPRQFQFTLFADDLPEEFVALAGSYALNRLAENDVATIGRFRAIWQAAAPANQLSFRLARLEATEQTVMLRFLNDAGQESSCAWQRTDWTIPFLLTGPMPLNPRGSACNVVTLWPTPKDD